MWTNEDFCAQRLVCRSSPPPRRPRQDPENSDGEAFCDHFLSNYIKYSISTCSNCVFIHIQFLLDFVKYLLKVPSLGAQATALALGTSSPCTFAAEGRRIWSGFVCFGRRCVRDTQLGSRWKTFKDLTSLAAIVICIQGAQLVRGWGGAAIVICSGGAQFSRVAGGAPIGVCSPVVHFARVEDGIAIGISSAASCHAREESGRSTSSERTA